MGTLHHRIGLVYVPGALPCFEDFGNLPTDLVGSDALVEGKPASQVLDMLIIPGGSLIESQSVNDKVASEVRKMAATGKFVLGVCSGFQVLAKETDIGRRSSIPITRKGLGLLGVEFKPLICTDRVTATVTGKSFITQEVGKEVTGFHCHTYGKTVLQKGVHPILVTHAKHINYFEKSQDLISGVANKEGNVVGIFVHGLLDDNPTIIESIMKSLRINVADLEEIRRANAVLLKRIKNEVGISANIKQQTAPTEKKKHLLLVTATGSDAGKTFIVAGIAGALKKRGFKVGIIKVGGDVRDTVPALYLTKEAMKNFSSIIVGDSGWKPLKEAITEAYKNYDFILVEGAMGAFTGILMETNGAPNSTAEVAAELNAATVVISSCDNDGVEGGMINSLNYITLLQKLGVRVKGAILNKAKMSYLPSDAEQTVNNAFEKVGVKLLGIVPKMDIEGRGMIPEIEIAYERFGAQAIEAAERHLNLDELIRIADSPGTQPSNHKVFMEKFKALIGNYHLHT